MIWYYTERHKGIVGLVFNCKSEDRKEDINPRMGLIYRDRRDSLRMGFVEDIMDTDSQ